MDDFLIKHWLLRAYTEAVKSPDPSSQNGSGVYVRSQVSRLCDAPCEGSSDGHTWNFAGAGFNHPTGDYDREKYLSDRDYRLKVTVHAEAAGLYAAARNGFCTNNAVLVCPWAACVECAKTIAELGVKTLIRHKQALEFAQRVREEQGYPQWDPRGSDDWLLEHRGVNIIEFDGTVGGPLVRNSGREFHP